MRWILSFHIISFVCWFAGLFYLPRLFVYHATVSDELSNERFKLMEHKLYHFIMTPAAVATIFWGLWLLHYNLDYYLHLPWMILKLILVFILIIYHGFCGYYVKQFKLDYNARNEKFFRYFNEIPSVLLIAIVILVVVQPNI